MDFEPEVWVAHEQERLHHEHEQLGQMVETVARLVLANHEHAKVIRQLRATVERHESELATARAGITDARSAVAGFTELIEATGPTSVRELQRTFQSAVDAVDGRLKMIEHALPVIEKKVGLKRRADAWEHVAPEA